MSKAKGSTPPEITSGSYVSWDGGKGRVDLVVSTGKVPGVSEDVEGTEKSPAARVVVYEDDKATSKKIGASTHTLRRIPPIRGSKSLTHPSMALVDALAAHEEAVEVLGLPEHARVSGKAMKAVYDRGIKSYPGSDLTTLDAAQWAYGRVEHFVKVATGDAGPTLGHDTDLLDPAHPDYTGEPPLDGGVDITGQPALGEEPTTPPQQPAEEPVEEPVEGEEPPSEETTETPAGEPDGDDPKVEEKGATVVLDAAQIDADLADLMAEVD